MVDTLNLNKNSPVAPNEGPVGRDQEGNAAHRHAEHDAMDAAKRAGERMKKNEAGNDIISK
ncbi:MAG: hypothetical protein ACYDC6_06240 [Acidobacteriaceae bacterium]